MRKSNLLRTSKCRFLRGKYPERTSFTFLELHQKRPYSLSALLLRMSARRIRAERIDLGFKNRRLCRITCKDCSNPVKTAQNQLTVHIDSAVKQRIKNLKY